MKAIIKRPGEDAQIVELENTLDALQEAVGGGIEAVSLFTDAAIVCNRDGVAEDLGFNLRFCGVPFFGPIVIVGTVEDIFRDLPNAQFLCDSLNGKRYVD